MLPCTMYKVNVPEIDREFAKATFDSLFWLNLSEAPISTICFLKTAKTFPNSFVDKLESQVLEKDVSSNDPIATQEGE